MLSGLLARLRLDPRLSSMVAALIVIAIVLNLTDAGRSCRRRTSTTCRSRPASSRSWPAAWCTSSSRARSTCRSARCWPSRHADRVRCRPWLPADSPRLGHQHRRRARLGTRCGRVPGCAGRVMRVPAFIVTLAGYLMFRGAAFLVADGQTLAPLHQTYQALGGGVDGARSAPTWSMACSASLAARWVSSGISGPRGRAAPLQASSWRRSGSTRSRAALMCAAILGFVATMSALPDFATRTSRRPRGQGIGVPVLILVAVVAVLTFVAQRTRFGRYVFAYGGNPEAALLSGLPTKRVLVWSLFMLMGVLVGDRRGHHDVAPGFGHQFDRPAGRAVRDRRRRDRRHLVRRAAIGYGARRRRRRAADPDLDNGMVLLDVSSPKRQIVIGMVLIGRRCVSTCLTSRQPGSRDMSTSPLVEMRGSCRSVSAGSAPSTTSIADALRGRGAWGCSATTAPARRR